MIELIKNVNQSIEIVEKDTNIKLMASMLKGDDGGYYIPSIENGVLSWTPTEPEMPPVEDTDFKVNVNLDGYATEQYVDDKLADFTEVDLTPYALKTEIPTLDGYATEQYVRDAIDAIPEVDLTGLATEAFVNTAVATEETERAKADAALETKISGLESNVNTELNNITTEYKATDAAIQKALDTEIERATKAEGINADAIAALQLKDTALQANIDAEAKARAEALAEMKEECNAENDALREDIGKEQERALAAESALQSSIEAETANRDKAISAAIAAIPETDLTDYAKKTDIPNKVSAFENDKGYLTEHQSLKGYATEAFVTSAIGAIPETDLTGYAKESYVDEKVASVIDTAPEALNTLNELSAALGDDPNFATTVSTEIGKKVDKEDGKGLTSNDFTNAYKSKLDGIAANANNYTHPASHPATMITGLANVATTGDYKDLSNTPEEYTHPVNHPASMITGLATVATSGKYSDLSGLPTIPSAYTHPATHPASMITGLSTVATSGKYSDLSGLPTIPAAYTHPTTHPASMITGLATVATSGKYSDLSNKPTLATVATSGSYNDLSNKPTIPSAYTHPSSHPASMITGLATVATSGSYNDLSNKPTIPAAYTHPSSHPASMITGLHSCATDGNAAKVGGKQIVVASSAPTTNDANIITFVI